MSLFTFSPSLPTAKRSWESPLTAICAIGKHRWRFQPRGDCLRNTLPKMSTSLKIKIDDLSSPEIHDLLAEHLRCMAAVSPPESRHALNLDGLRKPEITFWSVWQGGELVGCGALKELGAEHGEIK